MSHERSFKAGLRFDSRCRRFGVQIEPSYRVSDSVRSEHTKVQSDSKAILSSISGVAHSGSETDSAHDRLGDSRTQARSSARSRFTSYRRSDPRVAAAMSRLPGYEESEEVQWQESWAVLAAENKRLIAKIEELQEKETAAGRAAAKQASAATKKAKQAAKEAAAAKAAAREKKTQQRQEQRKRERELDPQVYKGKSIDQKKRWRAKKKDGAAADAEE